jgi:glycosyltransferase involved in cell wall biosynthesis
VTDDDVPDADVVIATWWETAEWVAKLSPSKGAKVHFIQGDEADLCHDEASRRRVVATWKLPTAKIAVARWLVNLGAERCTGQSIALVPNAVDLELFTAPPRNKQIVPTVGLIYSSSPVKGADIMLEAYRLAKRDLPALRLIGFGDSPEDGGPPWPPDVPFETRPPQQRLPDLYASCDSWLFGTRREGFGLPVLEAMACRTPVIGTPAGAAPELIGPGGGILVKPQNPADMAAAIKRIAGMPSDQWRAMSDVAHRTSSGYSWDGASRLFEEALKRAAAAALQGAGSART